MFLYCTRYRFTFDRPCFGGARHVSHNESQESSDRLDLTRRPTGGFLPVAFSQKPNSHFLKYKFRQCKTCSLFESSTKRPHFKTSAEALGKKQPTTSGFHPSAGGSEAVNSLQGLYDPRPSSMLFIALIARKLTISFLSATVGLLCY